ncbi:MAG: hypothetical protein Q8R78_04175, partial [Candidatus Omnitrophota bacterium]|nr:hypothetical protein [Candidatus Omnitrophota bacterium]
EPRASAVLSQLAGHYSAAGDLPSAAGILEETVDGVKGWYYLQEARFDPEHPDSAVLTQRLAETGTVTGFLWLLAFMRRHEADEFSLRQTETFSADLNTELAVFLRDAQAYYRQAERVRAQMRQAATVIDETEPELEDRFAPVLAFWDQYDADSILKPENRQAVADFLKAHDPDLKDQQLDPDQVSAYLRRLENGDVSNFQQPPEGKLETSPISRPPVRLVPRDDQSLRTYMDSLGFGNDGRLVVESSRGLGRFLSGQEDAVVLRRDEDGTQAIVVHSRGRSGFRVGGGWWARFQVRSILDFVYKPAERELIVVVSDERYEEEWKAKQRATRGKAQLVSWEIISASQAAERFEEFKDVLRFEKVEQLRQPLSALVEFLEQDLAFESWGRPGVRVADAVLEQTFFIELGLEEGVRILLNPSAQPLEVLEFLQKLPDDKLRLTEESRRLLDAKIAELKAARPQSTLPSEEPQAPISSRLGIKVNKGGKPAEPETPRGTKPIPQARLEAVAKLLAQLDPDAAKRLSGLAGFYYAAGLPSSAGIVQETIDGEQGWYYLEEARFDSQSQDPAVQVVHAQVKRQRLTNAADWLVAMLRRHEADEFSLRQTETLSADLNTELAVFLKDGVSFRQLPTTRTREAIHRAALLLDSLEPDLEDRLEPLLAIWEEPRFRDAEDLLTNQALWTELAAFLQAHDPALQSQKLSVEQVAAHLSTLGPQKRRPAPRAASGAQQSNPRGQRSMASVATELAVKAGTRAGKQLAGRVQQVAARKVAESKRRRTAPRAPASLDEVIAFIEGRSWSVWKKPIPVKVRLVNQHELGRQSVKFSSGTDSDKATVATLDVAQEYQDPIGVLEGFEHEIVHGTFCPDSERKLIADELAELRQRAVNIQATPNPTSEALNQRWQTWSGKPWYNDDDARQDFSRLPNDRTVRQKKYRYGRGGNLQIEVVRSARSTGAEVRRWDHWGVHANFGDAPVDRVFNARWQEAAGGRASTLTLQIGYDDDPIILHQLPSRNPILDVTVTQSNSEDTLTVFVSQDVVGALRNEGGRRLLEGMAGRFRWQIVSGDEQNAATSISSRLGVRVLKTGEVPGETPHGIREIPQDSELERSVTAHLTTLDPTAAQRLSQLAGRYYMAGLPSAAGIVQETIDDEQGWYYMEEARYDPDSAEPAIRALHEELKTKNLTDGLAWLIALWRRHETDEFALRQGETLSADLSTELAVFIRDGLVYLYRIPPPFLEALSAAADLLDQAEPDLENRFTPYLALWTQGPYRTTPEALRDRSRWPELAAFLQARDPALRSQSFDEAAVARHLAQLDQAAPIRSPAEQPSAEELEQQLARLRAQRTRLASIAQQTIGALAEDTRSAPLAQVDPQALVSEARQFIKSRPWTILDDDTPGKPVQVPVIGFRRVFAEELQDYFGYQRGRGVTLLTETYGREGVLKLRVIILRDLNDPVSILKEFAKALQTVGGSRSKAAADDQALIQEQIAELRQRLAAAQPDLQQQLIEAWASGREGQTFELPGEPAEQIEAITKLMESTEQVSWDQLNVGDVLVSAGEEGTRSFQVTEIHPEEADKPVGKVIVTRTSFGESEGLSALTLRRGSVRRLATAAELEQLGQQLAKSATPVRVVTVPGVSELLQVLEEREAVQAEKWPLSPSGPRYRELERRWSELDEQVTQLAEAIRQRPEFKQLPVLTDISQVQSGDVLIHSRSEEEESALVLRGPLGEDWADSFEQLKFRRVAGVDATAEPPTPADLMAEAIEFLTGRPWNYAYGSYQIQYKNVMRMGKETFDKWQPLERDRKHRVAIVDIGGGVEVAHIRVREDVTDPVTLLSDFAEEMRTVSLAREDQDLLQSKIAEFRRHRYNQQAERLEQWESALREAGWTGAAEPISLSHPVFAWLDAQIAEAEQVSDTNRETGQVSSLVSDTIRAKLWPRTASQLQKTLDGIERDRSWTALLSDGVSWTFERSGRWFDYVDFYYFKSRSGGIGRAINAVEILRGHRRIRRFEGELRDAAVSQDGKLLTVVVADDEAREKLKKRFRGKTEGSGRVIDWRLVTVAEVEANPEAYPELRFRPARSASSRSAKKALPGASGQEPSDGTDRARYADSSTDNPMGLDFEALGLNKLEHSYSESPGAGSPVSGGADGKGVDQVFDELRQQIIGEGLDATLERYGVDISLRAKGLRDALLSGLIARHPELQGVDHQHIADRLVDILREYAKQIAARREIANPAIIESLEGALSDSDWHVRLRAAEALEKVGQLTPERKLRRYVADLVDAEHTFVDWKWRGREEATHGIADVGSPLADAAVPTLVEVLDSLDPSNPDDSNLRYAIVKAAGRLGTAASPVLLKALRDTRKANKYLRARAAELLGEIESSAGSTHSAVKDLFAKRQELRGKAITVRGTLRDGSGLGAGGSGQGQREAIAWRGGSFRETTIRQELNNAAELGFLYKVKGLNGYQYEPRSWLVDATDEQAEQILELLKPYRTTIPPEDVPKVRAQIAWIFLRDMYGRDDDAANAAVDEQWEVMRAADSSVTREQALVRLEWELRLRPIENVFPGDRLDFMISAATDPNLRHQTNVLDLEDAVATTRKTEARHVLVRLVRLFLGLALSAEDLDIIRRDSPTGVPQVQAALARLVVGPKREQLLERRGDQFYLKPMYRFRPDQKILIRPNNLHSAEAAGDYDEVFREIGPLVVGFYQPKPYAAFDVDTAIALVEEIQEEQVELQRREQRAITAEGHGWWRQRHQPHVLIELAPAVLSLREIALASPRLEELQVGVVDLIADLGMRASVQDDQFPYLRYAMLETVAVGEEFGKMPGTGVTVPINADRAAEMTETAIKLGFRIRWSINPRHTEGIARYLGKFPPLVRKYLRYDPERIRRARVTTEELARKEREAKSILPPKVFPPMQFELSRSVVTVQGGQVKDFDDAAESSVDMIEVKLPWRGMPRQSLKRTIDALKFYRDIHEDDAKTVALGLSTQQDPRIQEALLRRVLDEAPESVQAVILSDVTDREQVQQFETLLERVERETGSAALKLGIRVSEPERLIGWAGVELIKASDRLRWLFLDLPSDLPKEADDDPKTKGYFYYRSAASHIVAAAETGVQIIDGVSRQDDLDPDTRHGAKFGFGGKQITLAQLPHAQQVNGLIDPPRKPSLDQVPEAFRGDTVEARRERATWIN